MSRAAGFPQGQCDVRWLRYFRRGLISRSTHHFWRNLPLLDITSKTARPAAESQEPRSAKQHNATRQTIGAIPARPATYRGTAPITNPGNGNAGNRDQRSDRPAQGQPERRWNNGGPRPPQNSGPGQRGGYGQRRRPGGRPAFSPTDDRHPDVLPELPARVARKPLEGNLFAKLGLSDGSAVLLEDRSITVPTPIQEMTIPDAMAGRDVCGKARTGSGKTLAFGLPMIERMTRGKPGLPAGLILVPTRELANQVARALSDFAAERRFRIITVYGGVPLGGQVRGIRMGADIIVATPGRLNDLIEREIVSMEQVQVAVVDEADQMADFGFMPQVERILDGLGKERQVLLFSATLDGEIARLTKKYQVDAVQHEAPVEEDDESTISHRFIGVDPMEKVAVSASIAAGPDRTIMFVRTQRAAERLSINLAREGVVNGTLHGGLSQNRRERALEDFASGRIPVLVATNIAARGIHVDDIGIVVHHDPPEDLKTFVHRSGRTARAGASGIVVTLVEPSQARDVSMLKRQAGIRESVVSMNSTDPRLGDLAGWEPPIDAEPDPNQRSERRGYAPRPAGAQGNGGGARRTWRRR